jgi:hypothetical protein
MMTAWSAVTMNNSALYDATADRWWEYYKMKKKIILIIVIIAI